MNLYFDTEFTGLHKDTTLISIGIVAENEKGFYAEFSDYDRSQCDDWIEDNVINNLRLYGVGWCSGAEQRIQELKSRGYEVSLNPSIPKDYSILEYGISHETEDGSTEVYGDTVWVSSRLEKWLSQFDEVQFVSDVCHYDFSLLIDLFGDAWDLPKNVNPACHDINQDIAKHYGISEREAFGKSREEIVQELCGDAINGEKHNALYDARVIKAIYERMYQDNLSFKTGD